MRLVPRPSFAQLSRDAIMRDGLPYHVLREFECIKIRMRDGKSAGQAVKHRCEQSPLVSFLLPA